MKPFKIIFFQLYSLFLIRFLKHFYTKTKSSYIYGQVGSPERNMSGPIQCSTHKAMRCLRLRLQCAWVKVPNNCFFWVRKDDF